MAAVLTWVIAIYGVISFGVSLTCWDELRGDDDMSKTPLLDRVFIGVMGFLTCAMNGLIWPYHIGWLVFQWLKRDR